MNNLNDDKNPKTYYYSNMNNVCGNKNINKQSLSKRIIRRISKLSGNLVFIAASGAMTHKFHNEVIKCLDNPMSFSNLKSLSINFAITNIGIISVIAGSLVLGYQLKSLIIKNNQNQKN